MVLKVIGSTKDSATSRIRGARAGDQSASLNPPSEALIARVHPRARAQTCLKSIGAPLMGV